MSNIWKVITKHMDHDKDFTSNLTSDLEYKRAHFSISSSLSFVSSKGHPSAMQANASITNVSTFRQDPQEDVISMDPIDPPLLKQSMTMVILLSAAYMLVFLLAVVNNILVVTVIVRTPQMRTVTNLFLANLAVADITVSFIVLPITLLSNLFTEWLFSPFLCKAIPYLQAVAVSASVNTLAAISLERYFAIFYPQRNVIPTQKAAWIISIIWFVPMCIQIPWALYYSYNAFPHTKYTRALWICYPAFPTKDWERHFFLGALFITCYLVPLCFLSIFYSLIGIKVWRRSVAGIRGSKTERNIQKSKVRIVRMLIVVAVFFTLSWLPVYSIRLRILYGSPPQETERHILKYLIPLAQWLGSANSCVNPFIYCYFSEQFRKGILALIGSNSCNCLKKLTSSSKPKKNGTRTLTVKANLSETQLSSTAVTTLPCQ